jgi:hypothetical protein
VKGSKTKHLESHAKRPRGEAATSGPARDAHQTPHELHVCLEPRPARMHTPHRETVWCGWLDAGKKRRVEEESFLRAEIRDSGHRWAGLGIFPPCEARLFVTWLATLWKRLRQPGCTFPLFRSFAGLRIGTSSDLFLFYRSLYGQARGPVSDGSGKEDVRTQGVIGVPAAYYGPSSS